MQTRQYRRNACNVVRPSRLKSNKLFLVFQRVLFHLVHVSEQSSNWNATDCLLEE